MRISVAFHTLGCKLNQLETESLADAFLRGGATLLREGSGGADLVVINTCTVTGKAEQKARRLVRQTLASNPGAVALVTGCYAQVEAGAIASLHERAVVVPGDRKSALLGLPSFLVEEWQGHGDLLEAVRTWVGLSSGRASDPFAFRPEEFAFHSRPALKIEDGCDNRCSYCRVRIARGPARSLAATEILARLRALEAADKAEVVLAGVNLHQYRDGERCFPALLSLLLEGTERIAIRLSSYEPEGLNEEFLEVFSHSRVRPHLHLPVQSGSDRILRSMARAYRRDKVISGLEAARRVKGDLFVAADLIAGFPGESDEDFAATLDLAEQCGFAWIHAFPFSPRPGTAAWDMGPKVPERVAGERVSALGATARSGRAAYLARQVGTEVEAVLEGACPVGADGIGRATTENYLKVKVAGLPAGLRGGSKIRCRLELAQSESAPPARSLFSGEFRPLQIDARQSLRISPEAREGVDSGDFDLKGVHVGVARGPIHLE